MEKRKLTFTPSAEIEGKYNIVNTEYPILHCRLGKLDFRTITLAQADDLFATGSVYLQKVRAKGKQKALS